MTHNPTWTVAEAKAKFSQVIERTRSGPQTVTRNGRPAAVVSAEEWERRASRTGTLAEFLAASPCAGPAWMPSAARTARATSSLELPTRHKRRLGMDEATTQYRCGGVPGDGGRGRAVPERGHAGGNWGAACIGWPWAGGAACSTIGCATSCRRDLPAAC